MATASSFLADIVVRARTNAPSVTTATLQRSSQREGVRRWSPGLSGFGWGINGTIVTSSNNDPIGIKIGVLQWFSDRITNRSASPPDYQQFSARDRDRATLTFTRDGSDQVKLRVDLLTWNSNFEVRSFLFDEETQQLLFHVPGAGAGSPRAIMIVTFHPTGSFGFLRPPFTIPFPIPPFRGVRPAPH